ncbi:MAG: HTH domain-containing protein, partial [Bacilli bacterium]|nr:HTH domain-containing protein [Bacilli bacterium]
LQTIAKYSGCSVRTVHARIKALEDLNLLEVERTKGGGYGKAVNTNTFYTSNGKTYYYEFLEVHNLRYEYQEETIEENVIEFNTKSLELEQKETTEEREDLDTRVIEFESKDNTTKRNNNSWDIEDNIKNDIKKEPKSSHLFSPNYDLCH